MEAELANALRDNPTNGYLRYHLPRYQLLLTEISSRYRDGMNILDIGRSAFTDILLARFKQVDTLGFATDSSTPGMNHFQFDLNHARDAELWRHDLPKYDIVVFTEVIEHLYTSPSQVLSFLHHLMKDDGILLLQTPNAAAIHKRIKLLFGRNPYELIREDDRNPGHFREYTAKELCTLLVEGGFNIESHGFKNYFDYQYSDHKDDAAFKKDTKRSIYNLMFAIMPPSLRPGIFIIARKREVDP